jgi:uncharacterized pyridoxal phosphate-containing UPF0001 family protein
MVNYLTCQDNVTFSDAVAAAQQYEKGCQSVHLQAISQTMPVAPSYTAATAKAEEDPLDQLTKRTERLLQPVVDVIGSLSQRSRQKTVIRIDKLISSVSRTKAPAPLRPKDELDSHEILSPVTDVVSKGMLLGYVPTH